MSIPLTEHDWRIRAHVYAFFVEQARPPTALDLAARLDLPPDTVQQAYHRLNAAHAIFLEPGSDSIRMANPLSAVPTGFLVRSGGRAYWANCAWDSLGIPAMLRADADIEARIPGEAEPVRYQVRGGQLDAPPALVHFPLPVRHWYDDLIHT